MLCGIVFIMCMFLYIAKGKYTFTAVVESGFGLRCVTGWDGVHKNHNDSFKSGVLSVLIM